MRSSHIGDDGRVSMVDVGGKAVTERSAKARAVIAMGADCERALRDASLAKGDAFAVARLAGILAAKETPRLIPLAHTIALSSVDVAFAWLASGKLAIDATAHTVARTGVEMEAMTAASIAALALYDMLKSIERGVTVESVRLLEKRGGASGTWLAEPD